jgi:hypothetical protein
VLSKEFAKALAESDVVSIDFGTAEPEAFWEILQLLEGAGAKNLRVSSSRAEATNLDGT